MKTYARIEAGAVAELLHTTADPKTLFHPAVRWVEASDPKVAVGWVEGPTGLAPPAPAPAATAAVPSLAELHAQVAELATKVAALSAAH